MEWLKYTKVNLFIRSFVHLNDVPGITAWLLKDFLRRSCQKSGPMETRQIKIKQKTFDSFFWQALSKAFWKSKQIIFRASPLASILLTLWKDLNRSRCYTFCKGILRIVFFIHWWIWDPQTFYRQPCVRVSILLIILKINLFFSFSLSICKLLVFKKQIIVTPLW